MEKLRKYSSKKNICMLLIVLLIVLFSVLPQKEKAYISHYECKSVFENTLEADSSIEDEFSAKMDSDGIAITIGTYMKVLEKGKMNIKIFDNQTNENVFSEEIPFSSISDACCLDIRCKILKDHKYKIKINIKDIDSNNRIVFSKSVSGNEGTYIINNKVEKGNLNINYIVQNVYFGNVWMLILAIVLVYYIIIDNRGV